MARSITVILCLYETRKDYRPGKNNRLCPCGEMAGKHIKVLQIEKGYVFWWGKGYPPKWGINILAKGDSFAI